MPFTTFGNAEVIKAGSRPSKWAIELVSFDYEEVDDFFAGISFEPPEGLLVSDLEELSATYEVLEGNIGGGSPRFSIVIDTDDDGEADGSLFVYLGSPPDYSDGQLGRSRLEIFSTASSMQVSSANPSMARGMMRWRWSRRWSRRCRDSFGRPGCGRHWATDEGLQSIAVYEVQVNDYRLKVNGSNKK